MTKKKGQNGAKTTGKTADKAADESATAPEEKTDNTSETSAKVTGEKIPDGFRKFTLTDVLLVLAEIRADLAKMGLMAGIKSAGHQITIVELRNGIIEIPVQSKKDAKKAQES